jgi:hypothetical protein
MIPSHLTNRLAAMNVRAKRVLVCAATALALTVGFGLATPADAQALPNGYWDVKSSANCTMWMDQYNRIYKRTIVPDTPGMGAPVANMTISWQPILFRLYNGTWHREVVGPELKGYFNGLYSVLPASAGFTLNLAGATWRVAVFFRWYWNGGVYQTDYQWAGAHYQTYLKTFPDGSFQVSRGDSGDTCKVL